MSSADSFPPRRPPADPPPKSGVRVSARFSIPRDELVTRVSRASGAGGQHVNKTSSRVELVWNVMTSRVLSDAQRERLLAQLASRLTEAGDLRVVVSDTRSQLQNRELAEARLVALVRGGLVVPKVRKATKPTKASKEKRIETKRRTTEKKRDRRWRNDE